MACLVFKHEFLATLKARPTDDSSAAVVVGVSESWEEGGGKGCREGLYRTSCPVGKFGKFSKSGLSRNRTFSLPDTGLLTLLKIEKKIQEKKKIKIEFIFIFFIYFSHQICVQGPYLMRVNN